MLLLLTWAAHQLVLLALLLLWLLHARGQALSPVQLQALLVLLLVLLALLLASLQVHALEQQVQQPQG